jgi:hypothetical protein
MEKWIKWFGGLLIVAFMIAGCGKQSGIEGKIVDGKDQPISGLKVIVKQVQPIKGYEQCEAITSSDGSFKFEKLYPSSEYVVSVHHKDWNSDDCSQFTAGPQGKTMILKEPIQVGFAQSSDDVITDTATGREWFVGPDKDTTWNQANAWCTSLAVDGGGWRMPTMEELKSLYITGPNGKNMSPLFKASAWWVWSGDKRDSSSAWYVRFITGEGHWDNRNAKFLRAFAVRSPK